MGVITEEIELPDPASLRRPAGLPQHTRNPISEITAFDRHAGDRSRPILIAAAAGALLIGLFAIFEAGDPPPPQAEKPVPALAAAPEKVEKVEKVVAPEPEPEPAPVEAPVEAPQPELVASKRVMPIEEAGPGTLSVTSDPRVAVYEGDKRLGRTPLEVKLSPGLHKLRLVNRRFHLEETRRVRIRSDKTRKIDLLFGMSKLVVTAPEGTKVYLDKRFMGRTPIEPIKLAEGRHHLKLVGETAQMSERLDIPPSRTVEYAARF